MRKFVNRSVSAVIAAMSLVLVSSPLAAQAAPMSGDAKTTAHIARSLAQAPRNATHLSVVVYPMRAIGPKLTSYTSCGAWWMSIADQGRGHAWIAFGVELTYPGYAVSWGTAVAPQGSRSGYGPIPPWHAFSWDGGYSAFEGYGVPVSGSVFMIVNMYPWSPYAICGGGTTAYGYAS
jgi:hypothetical protein